MAPAVDSLMNDIRLLRLAEMYESAFEAFVVELAARDIRDASLRKELLTVISPDEDHGGRVQTEMQRLHEALGPEAAAALERGAILDVIDIERAAREFYMTHVDSVHDPRVVKLFRELAMEEDRHARIAERVLVKSGHSARVDEIRGSLLGSARP